MNGILETLKSLGTGRLVLMGVVAAVLLTAFIVITTRIASPRMSLLYGDLGQSDSAQIVTKLEQMGVPFELRAGGAQIYVPEEQALRLRLSMATDGLPSGGSLGYELFDRGDNLGTSSFVQNINHLRALEGELSRTIRELDGVAAARVHLVLPKRQLFTRKQQAARASIILKLVGNRRLNEEQVSAIQYLVSSAIAELSPDSVSIVDTRGTLLSGRQRDAKNGSENLAQLQRDFEDKLKGRIESMVEKSVGIGNVRVELTADIDFDRSTTNSETYDPDSQVARSASTVEENSSSTERNQDGTVSVTQNLPGANQNADDQPGKASTTTRTEETTNFEISKTVRQEVHESGTIKRLSVAVLVNDTPEVGADGNVTFTARNQEELDKIDALVKTAVGFDEQRGDQVRVVNMRFTQFEDTLFKAQTDLGVWSSLSKADYFRAAELLALFIVVVLLSVLVLRPLLAVFLNSRQNDASADGPVLQAPAGVPQLPGMTRAQIRENPEIIRAVESGEISPEEYDQLLSSAPERLELPPEDEGDGIDIAMIEGRVKASSIRKIGELVDKHPEEAVAIMRSWMYQDA